MMATPAAAITMTAAMTAVAGQGDGSTAPIAQQQAGKDLVAERCTRCHAIGVIEARQGTAQEWHEIVERMINNGAQVTQEEVDVIVAYLASTYAPSSAVAAAVKSLPSCPALQSQSAHLSQPL
jgi:mono/diheme cytochrome c family protein